MQRWEYSWVTISFKNQKSVEEGFAALNEAGENGWEAVGVSTTAGDLWAGLARTSGIVVLFKRPKPDPAS